MTSLEELLAYLGTHGAVEARLTGLPDDLQALWRTLQSRIGSGGRTPQ